MIEGKFFPTRTAILAECTFNDDTQQTLSISNPNPFWNHQMKWILSKKRLVAFKAARVPVKLNFYGAEENSVRQLLGYVVLSLRDGNDDKEQWHSLLYSKQAAAPEVKILFRICKKSDYEEEQLEKKKRSRLIVRERKLRQQKDKELHKKEMELLEKTRGQPKTADKEGGKETSEEEGEDSEDEEGEEEGSEESEEGEEEEEEDSEEDNEKEKHVGASQSQGKTVEVKAAASRGKEIESSKKTKEENQLKEEKGSRKEKQIIRPPKKEEDTYSDDFISSQEESILINSNHPPNRSKLDEEFAEHIRQEAKSKVISKRHWRMSIDLKHIRDFEFPVTHLYFKYNYPLFGTDTPVYTHPPIQINPAQTQSTNIPIPAGFCLFEFALPAEVLQSRYFGFIHC